MLSDVIVRFAGPDDLASIKLVADEFRNELGFVFAAELLRGISDRSVIVAEVGGKVLGFIYFRCRKDRVAVIYAIAVTKEWQRCGIGRKLVEEFERVASDRGCVMAKLKCPASSLGANVFYRKIGYKFCGIVDGKKQKLFVWKKVL